MMLLLVALLLLLLMVVVVLMVLMVVVLVVVVVTDSATPTHIFRRGPNFRLRVWNSSPPCARRCKYSRRRLTRLQPPPRSLASGGP